MSIMQNVACPECQKTGHDKTGNHLIVFADGARHCNRSHFHESGKTLYIPSDGEDPVLTAKLDGNTKFTVDQFETLKQEGKLDNENVRAVVLGGMRQADAYAVASPEERDLIEEDWKHDIEYFNGLPTKNLVSRAIKGNIAKLYNVRVGLDATGKIQRHYYPRYEEGLVIGAKCRTLPKDFRAGTLGRTWGTGELFGQSTMQAVLDSGRRIDTLVLFGGECDAMAGQQMLLEAQEGTKWAGTLYHCWSPMKGEHCLEEILQNKEAINKFKKILVAFDDDETGKKLNKAVARLFRGKTMKLQYPDGTKDSNQCLMEGRAKEFVDAYFNPVEVFGNGILKTVAALSERAKVMPSMGLSWPWPSMDWLTFGIRPYTMYVLGAGTGVGKTETTKEVCFHLIQQHDKQVGVIYLEEQPEYTVRSYAGKLINKRLADPNEHDKSSVNYSASRDYTEDEANQAIDDLAAMGSLIVAETGGDKGIDMVMQLIEELLAMGVQYIVIDNLTAIELPKGSGNKVDAIDEAMKRMGTFKDAHPVTLFVISHLKRPSGDRTPHEQGGEVYITDFRGAGSITFWANGAFGIERNTVSEDKSEQSMTTYRCVKSRDNGLAGGKCVYAHMSDKTGRLLESHKTNKVAPQAPDKDVLPWEDEVDPDNEEF